MRGRPPTHSPDPRSAASVAEAKIRQAHKRQVLEVPMRAEEARGIRETRAYQLGLLHGLGLAVSYLNEGGR